MIKKINPIITSEMRSRMRGRRAFIILTIYLLLLSCLAGSVYATIYNENVNRSYYAYNVTAPNIQYGPVIGKAIFIGTTLLLLLIISHVAPAFTAGALAGEREKKTYDILIITPLRARQIVLGKLGAVFIFLLLLILASLPIQSLAFLFGGVALAEVLIGALGLLVTALAFGALGLYISSLSRTTMIALIVTYGLTIPFIYGLPLLLITIMSNLIQVPLFTGILFDQYNLSLISTILFIITGLILVYGVGFALSINPFSSAIMTGILAANGYGYFFFKESFGQNVTLWFLSPWLVYVIFYLLLTLLLLQLTVRRVAKISNI